MSRRQHLRSSLEAYQPADAREAEHRASILALLANEAVDAFSRELFEPGHITASAFVTDPKRESLLLILHGKLHRWLQPGGHIEAEDSDVLAAARREVREETGLALTDVDAKIFDVDVHTIPAGLTQPAHSHFDVRFSFSALQSKLVAESDARDARWVPIAELIAGAGPFLSDESVLRAVRKLIGRQA
jgi:8-oxo-dGTP pyrophosphatase MutT (NUDIX family)